MKSIGIRELRQRASECLRLVRHGEVIQVTDRGRPVATLVPIRPKNALDGLEATGRLTAEEGDLLDLGGPVRAKRGAPLPSKTLTEIRADER
ncbi:MAG TPA: type II toxin-antitoxin system prevent-host-death family antitoxin [Planctomycetota bacterium]|nr:type II toxin-antitoxin system prevent-host-death family antitoxin [Planctomycetota bacterium]